MTDLTTQTPSEIDTTLYGLYCEALDHKVAKAHAMDSIHRAAGDKLTYLWGRGSGGEWGLTDDEAIDKAQGVVDRDATYVGKQAAKALTGYTEAEAALVANYKATEPLTAEYRRRGGWTRAFLVTDGHVHSSRECSTCFETTRFTWLTDLSGHDEAEIVSLAGERACTVCYPSAPTLRDFEKASPLFTEEETARNKARAERNEAKAKRLADKIAKGLTADGSELVVVTERGVHPEDYYREHLRGKPYERTESFKTEKAAVQWVVSEMASPYGRINTETKIEARRLIMEAVAAKHGKPIEQVSQEIDAKVEAKIKRDRRGY